MSIPKHAQFEELPISSDNLQGIIQIQPVSQSVIDYEQNLTEWLAKLALKESGGSCTVSVIDKNGLRSVGLMQFQNATWITMGQVYNIPTTIENITDCNLQYKLTRLIIEDGGWQHWTCSVRGCPQYGIVGIGLPPMI